MNLSGNSSRSERRVGSSVASILSRWTRLSVLTAQSGLMVIAAFGTAHADQPAEVANASSPTAQAEENGEGLEEIVVTARRRSELLQDVPQTVTAVTSAELQKLNLQNLQDLSGVVPSLQIATSPNRSLDTDTFRGVSFQPASGTQNTLGFYINDTFVTNNFVTDSNFDIGQIELLSGPQGTLRGEPSPSGSLTITTRRPDLDQFGGYVTATGAQYSSFNGNGAINLPIIKDMLAVRLAAVAEDNHFDDVTSLNNPGAPLYHNYAERASVRFEPISSIEANVMYQHEYYHQNQYTQVAGPGAPGGVDPLAPANYNGPPLNALQRLAVQTFPNTQYNWEDLTTAQVDWHVLGQVLSYDGSYWKYDNNNGDTASFANQVPGITQDNPIPRKASQFNTPSITERTQTDELRLSSETPLLGFLDYTVGAFFRHTVNEVQVIQIASFLPGSFGSPAGPDDPFIYNPNYTLQLAVDSPAEEKENSEFAHVTFHLPYEFELTAGGRYINYKKYGSTEGTLLTPGTFIGVPGLGSAICGAISGLYQANYPGVCDIPATSSLLAPMGLGPQRAGSALALTPQGLSDRPWIYNVSLSHKFNPDLLAYVSSGSSWRPPGISVGIFNAANDPTLNSLLHLQSEKSTDIEGGFKWTFLEDRARLNVAYYHQSFTNFIYSGLPNLYLVDNGSGTNKVAQFGFNSNPNAVLNGVDLDTGFRFTRQWRFDLSGNYSNGHLTGSAVPCSPPSGGTTTAAFPPGTFIFLCPSHASTSTAPNFNSTAQTEYDQPLPGGIDGFIRGLYTFYGRNPHASQFYVTPSYGLLNLFLGVRSSDGAWEADVFIKNALDTQRTLSNTVGTAPIDFGAGASVAPLFGTSGYYGVTVTPQQQFGVTATYSFGSR
jgi:iron complex outermembrane receptor protein